MKALAVKYRPKTWGDVVEQSAVKIILQNQLDTDEIKGAYCFVGGAGTGKTTCARIFANEINKGQGNPIEMDAASNNGVDDVRELAKMAQTKSLDSEYKVFIIDECHLFSAGAWGAMLKLIEEPPAKSVFILCTTDYWKIPKTIQSRCERFQFKKISVEGIYERLQYIFLHEMSKADDYYYDKEALRFIAKLSDGCLRDAITMLDKCLAYNQELTTDNVLEALEMVDYSVFISLTDAIIYRDSESIISIIENVSNDGKDLKQFIHQYFYFVIDLLKYNLCNSFEYTQLPRTDEIKDNIKDWQDDNIDFTYILEKIMKLDVDLKYASNPKYLIEAELLV